MNVKILKHGYQRNGVGGIGYHYFAISWKDDFKKICKGIATLTVECDSVGEYPERFNGSCRVITPKNLDNHWRGDVFECEIRKQYKMWYN